MNNIVLPIELLDCCDIKWTLHYVTIQKFHDDIICALIKAAKATIPFTTPISHCNKSVPGRSEHVVAFKSD